MSGVGMPLGGGGIRQLTGDVTAGPGTGSQAATLATVNANVGTFTYATVTVDAKGRVTAAANGTAPDLSSVVALTPATAARNTIQPSADVVPLTVKGKAGQTAALQRWQTPAGADLIDIGSDGYATFANGLQLLWKDIGGTARRVLDMDTGPNVNLNRSGIANALQLFGDSIYLFDHSVNALAQFTTNGSTIFSPAAAKIPLIIKGASSQSADLQQWQDSTGAVLRRIDATGAIAIADAATNTVSDAAVISHTTSGTPAAGFGTGKVWQGHSSSNARRSMGRIRTIWDVATDASRTAHMVISAFDTAERDNILVGADGSNPTLGFYGTTPTAKQTVSGSRGGNAALTSLLTALANLGLIVDGSSA